MFEDFLVNGRNQLMNHNLVSEECGNVENHIQTMDYFNVHSSIEHNLFGFAINQKRRLLVYLMVRFGSIYRVM